MRPPATGKQEERQTGRQYRRQDLGKADTPSNTKADTLRKPTPTIHCLKKCKIRPPTTKGNKKKDKLGDMLGDKKEDKLGDKGDKKHREGGHTIQHRKQEGRQWETRGRQDLGKVDAPCNTGHTYLRRKWEVMKTKTSGRWTIQHRHIMGGNGRQWETMGDNGKHVETSGDKDRQEGRQGETRLREGGHTIQHRHTCRDNGRQFGNKTSGRRTHHPNIGTHVGTMGANSETRRREGGHTIQHRCTHAGRQWERMGSNGGPGEQWGARGDKTLKRRAHHPTQTHIVGRQSETSGDKTSGRQTYYYYYYYYF